MSAESVYELQEVFIRDCDRSIALSRQQIAASVTDIQQRCRELLPIDDLDDFLLLPPTATATSTSAKTHIYMGWYVSMLMKMRDDVDRVRKQLLPDSDAIAACRKLMSELTGRLAELETKITVNQEHLPDAADYSEPGQKKKYAARLQQWRQTGIRLTKQADKIRQELEKLATELAVLEDPVSGYTPQLIAETRERLQWQLRQASNAVDITRAYIEDRGFGSIEQHMTNFGRLDASLIPYLETTQAIVDRYCKQMTQLLARKNIEIDVHWSGSASRHA